MNLSEQSIKRAIEHIKKSKDTDLFPMLKEFEIFFDNENDFVNELKAIDIGEYNWQTYRRFIIPKDDVSYRIAVQLDPIDTILYEAIIFEYGILIENERISVSDNRVLVIDLHRLMMDNFMTKRIRGKNVGRLYRIWNNSIPMLFI